MASMIERPQTREEKLDYDALGKISPWQRFLAEVAEVEQEFAKKHEPFDGACAKLDYKDMMKRVENESERNFGYVRESDIDGIKIDLTVYGKKDRFDLVSTDEEMEQQVVTVGSKNTTKNVLVGYTLKYVCKERRHGVSVFMTASEYEERFNKGKKED